MLDLANAKTWSLADAKAHLSEIVDAALEGKPQILARRGDPPVVIVAKSAVTKAKPGVHLLELLKRRPQELVIPPRSRRRRPSLDLE